jgi:hypothetical protein
LAIISSIPAAYKHIVVAYKNSIRVYNSTVPATSHKTLEPYDLINLLRVGAQLQATSANATTFDTKPKKEESANYAS